MCHELLTSDSVPHSSPPVPLATHRLRRYLLLLSHTTPSPHTAIPTTSSFTTSYRLIHYFATSHLSQTLLTTYYLTTSVPHTALLTTYYLTTSLLHTARPTATHRCPISRFGGRRPLAKTAFLGAAPPEVLRSTNCPQQSTSCVRHCRSHPCLSVCCMTRRRFSSPLLERYPSSHTPTRALAQAPRWAGAS